MQVEVSVVISTYNRSTPLRRAITALLSQTGDVAYEILVVDNNSSDGTRDAVESLASGNQSVLRYLFEGRQGLSYARNCGIANARAPLVAFTDDDVQAANDWVQQIKTTFDAHPEIDFLGGKVLPRWPGTPPAWVGQGHWPPLALVDYGEQSFVVDAGRQLCLIGANFAFRRVVFEQLGAFKADFQRVKDGIGSLEDHEMLLRLWHAGRKGLYVPSLQVIAEIEPERLDKRYHRRWHTGHGRFTALLRLEQIERSRLRLFGVPGHLFRQAFADAVGWAVCELGNHPGRAFQHETRLRFFHGFVKQRCRDFFRRAHKRQN